jgi:hypothetical protein
MRSRAGSSLDRRGSARGRPHPRSRDLSGGRVGANEAEESLLSLLERAELAELIPGSAVEEDELALPDWRVRPLDVKPAFHRAPVAAPAEAAHALGMIEPWDEIDELFGGGA